MILVGAVAVVALALVFVSRPQPGPELRQLDLASMEPRVAEKIERAVTEVKTRPRDPDAWGMLGMVLHAHDLALEASECYARAIDLDPNKLDWHYLIVHTLRESDAVEALMQTESALAVGASYAPLHVVRAELLEEHGDKDQALEHYRLAVELDPESPLAVFGAGRLTLADGDISKSIGLLETAAKVDPEAGAIQSALSQAYRRAGERDKAMAAATRASELDAAVAITDPIHFRMRQESVSSITRLNRAIAFERSGDDIAAESLYRDLVSERPDDADIASRRAGVLARLGDLGMAKSEYERALGINPEHADANVGLGDVLNREGAYDEALEHYRKALAERPDDIRALVNIGGLLAFRGHDSEAEASFREAIDVDPDAFGPHRQLAALLMKREDWRGAIEQLEVAVETAPGFGPVHLELAVALASAGELEAALSHAKTARELGHAVPDELIERLERRLASS